MSIQELIDNPNEYDFYKAVFVLQQQLVSNNCKHNKVGCDGLPKSELVRFKADQHLGFPGQSVSKIDIKNSEDKDKVAVDMHVSFMGLTGISGALPQHYSELVLERLKLKDTGMRDFYDLFNHRLISLFYRAWEKYRFSVNYQSNLEAKSDSFTSVLEKLSGEQAIQKYYAGLFNKKVKTIDGLTLILRDFTQCEVNIKQFQGQWQRLSILDQTRLGGKKSPEGQFAALGVDATIGSKVWDINSAIAIVIKPNANTKIHSFLPGQKTSRLLKSLIKSYLGITTKFKIHLEIQTKQIPIAQLSTKSVPLGHGCGLLSKNNEDIKTCLLPL
ncbi:type VI secretion system baseplate subunit TssG [Colwellia sp. E2M01]|uniref:type VI secretion system baseplate subunit TssG n=1 Tax=Colwellia sp. E2M01 TaxID=2841561 RepID=UPI001C093DCB|nr:type VI secretion system baseplate subunit TssG [Colwellia sp. E2M01]MBU2870490.1 type VI secretion system baseplate subunit TssG [Colwellia sp. E2M01]